MLARLVTSVIDNEAEEKGPERISICRKYLLGAGSDPTATFIRYGSTEIGAHLTEVTFQDGVPVWRPVSIVGLRRTPI